MARIPLDLESHGLLGKLGAWYSRRRYGKVLDPGAAVVHNRKVAMANLHFERRVARWHTLDDTLQCLAVMAAAAAIGCEWCMDFGYWESTRRGVTRDKIEDVPRWRDSDAYTPAERLVLGYAEAMTATPSAVTDEMVAALRRQLSDEQLVELTALVALENYRSRSNSAFGLSAQGFKAECAVPPR
jgi:AhpD family alkylhydroperoxidase